MTDVDLIKLIGQSGIAVAALVVLAWVVKQVGERMITAIDRVGTKIDEHTKADTAALGAVSTNVSSLRQDIAVLGARVETAIELGERERDRRPNTGEFTRPRG